MKVRLDLTVVISQHAYPQFYIKRANEAPNKSGYSYRLGYRYKYQNYFQSSFLLVALDGVGSNPPIISPSNIKNSSKFANLTGG